MSKFVTGDKLPKFFTEVAQGSGGGEIVVRLLAPLRPRNAPFGNSFLTYCPHIKQTDRAS